jgi:protein tyrosine phosphatase (PTP) superfamily phosphohydrolase (DUF442 family)
MLESNRWSMGMMPRAFERGYLRLRYVAGLAAILALATSWAAIAVGTPGALKRVRVIEPGRLVRGAWQNPGALRTIIDRQRIKTVVTLTAINRDDPKYVGQSAVVSQTGVDWVIVPLRGSTATIEQMARAADLLADSSRQPVFFHCVAGHHRTNLVHAAYLIRHRGLSGDQAWDVIAGLPWTRPGSTADQHDRARIAEFARLQAFSTPSTGQGRP